ncbi:hypothetical protein OAE23_02505 [Synechococcus sp. AH-551-E11]|nr:hypothetical protein [Synechococcus sp. AH-551-E11]MDB4616951.1 hypothetical protein [Synechococcus sp. AH-551-E11]
MNNQEFLRIAILQIFNDATVGDNVNPLTLEELNKLVYLRFKDELIDRDIEWTWQHSIASSRKHLVDSKELIRKKVGKTTYYTPKG